MMTGGQIERLVIIVIDRAIYTLKAKSGGGGEDAE
jgi:hypothetical protein